MARVTGVMMFIVFVVKRTESNAEAETQQTKPDPYFEEWKDNAWQRPSRCHVCRLLVRELYESFTRTKRKDILYTEYQLDEQPLKKKIVYEKSEIRLLETMENVCDQMKSYVSRARRKFPYVKGAKSHFREGLDNMLANSTVKLNIEAPPDDLVDDSTKEIIRLKFKCVHMLEEFEEDITEWYFNYREENLLEWLCKFRVLAVEEQGCLHESDEVVDPEDDTTTTVYALDEKNEIKSTVRSEEKEEKTVAQESHSQHGSEYDWHNGDENINFSESHLDL